MNEVKLELKSVKEIVNILNRDLASPDVRVHNLHDTRSASYCNTNICKLAFETFYKESYCEMTAYKPYTVTNNRFQLLHNLQENDSSGCTE